MTVAPSAEFLPADNDVATLRCKVDELVAKVEALRAREEEEIKRRHALKLQAIGQLTAGVAHELNTPLQFIGDNLHFLREGMHGMLLALDALRRVRDSARSGTVHPDLVFDADAAEAAGDLDYLSSRLERGFERMFEGLARITTIVDAMKRFSHPKNEVGPVDINSLLQTTLTLTHNEYKYAAEVVTELGNVPLIQGHASDLGQVFLNMIVNAAHAITDRGTERGTITIRTGCEGNNLVITIADTGCGIDDHNRDHIFEPFFTTKDPGRGVGQGLALAHTVIVDGHGGSVTFDTKVGQGSAFHVRLPIESQTERVVP